MGPKAPFLNMAKRIFFLIFAFFILNIEYLLIFLFKIDNRLYFSVENIVFVFVIFFTKNILLQFCILLIASCFFVIERVSEIFPNLNRLNFFDVSELIKNLNGSWFFIVLLLIFLFLFLVILKLIFVKFLFKRITRKNLLLICVVFFSLVLLENSNEKVMKITQSTVLNYFKKFEDFEGVNFYDYSSSRFSSWPYETASDFLLSGESQKKAIIIVESWGVPNNRKLLEDQIGVFKGVENLDFSYKEVNFSGSTVHAEIRELCKKFPQSTIIEYIPDSENCLPNKFKKLGYETYALHAGERGYYGRGAWYPLVGFEKSFFFENEKKYGECYSWKGYCDIFFSKKFFDSLKDDGKKFVYWMTLNSHAPYDERDVKITKESECIKLGEKPKTGICNNYRIIKDLFLTIKKDLILMDDIDVYIVGDHPPPFFSFQDREGFGKIGLVPSMKITIKSNESKIKGSPLK